MRFYTLLVLLCFSTLCFAQFAANDDFDQDGIINEMDYDDDNDGIVDIYEENVNGSSCNLLSNYLRKTGGFGVISGTDLLNNSQINLISDVNSGSELSFSYSSVPEIEKLSFEYPSSTVSQIRIYNYLNGSVGNTTTPHVERISNIQLFNTTNQLIYETGTIYPTSVISGNSYHLISLPNLEGVKYMKITGLHAATNIGFGLRDIFLVGCTQDYDGDGIPNKFDTDSDNDGCPDAVESNAVSASQGYLFSQLDERYMVDLPIGTSGNVAGVPDSNRNNPVGAYDTSVQSYECDSCDPLSSIFTDFDQDGIADSCDDDLDNDGILNINECGYDSSFSSTPLTFFNLNSAVELTDTNPNDYIGPAIFAEQAGLTPDGIAVDVKITPLQLNTSKTPYFLWNLTATDGSKLFLGTSNSEYELEIEFFEHGTSNPIAVSTIFTASDIDGDCDWNGDLISDNNGCDQFSVTSGQVADDYMFITSSSFHSYHANNPSLIYTKEMGEYTYFFSSGSNNSQFSGQTGINPNPEQLQVFFTMKETSKLSVHYYTGQFGGVYLDLTDNHVSVCDSDSDGIMDLYDATDDLVWEQQPNFYMVQNGSEIVSLDSATGMYDVVTPISTIDSVDALSLNNEDSRLYGFCTTDGVTNFCMINPNGYVTTFDLQLTYSPIGATTTDSGLFYFVTDQNRLSYIDTNQAEFTITTTDIVLENASDLVYHANTNSVFTVSSSLELIQVDLTTAEVSNQSLSGSILIESGEFTALWTSNDGGLFAYNEISGKIYAINTSDLSTTMVLHSTSNIVFTDGFSFSNQIPVLESFCGDGIDNDQDGQIDCADGNCDLSPDCLFEICDNGIDDDGDGLVDCQDSECYSIESTCQEICDNGIDDDGDGLIDSEDDQCATTASIEGGLESNGRLSSLIAKRNYTIKKERPRDYYTKLNGLLSLELVPSNIIALGQHGATIQDLIPQHMNGLEVKDGSPNDLIGISNATDIVAADYYQNSHRIASVLGIESKDGVYEHTKYICDRLGGTRLVDISFIHFGEGKLIMYELLNEANQKEYAVTIAGYEDDEGFHIENHWNISNYPAQEKYYNIQIWANSPKLLIQLLNSVTDQLREIVPIVSVNTSAIPKLFISYGNYKNGYLNLHIINKQRVKEVLFSGKIRQAETNEIQDFSQRFELSGAKEEDIKIHTDYLYDLGFSMFSADPIQDELFIADGTWLADNNHSGVRLTKFEVKKHKNNSSYKTTNSHIFERSIVAEAEVKDYFNISRSVNAKYKAEDFEEYNTIAFGAYGTGFARVTIVKKGIQEWVNQFSAEIELTDDWTEFELSLSDFHSNQQDHLTLGDVEMIVITLFGDGSFFQPKRIEVSDLRFTTSENHSTNQPTVNTTDNPSSSSQNQIIVFPNPTSISLQVYSPTEIGYAKIINISGQFVTNSYKQNDRGVEFIVSDLAPGLYIVVLELADGSIVQDKFIKR